jgi:phage shock protein A
LFNFLFIHLSNFSFLFNWGLNNFAYWLCFLNKWWRLYSMAESIFARVRRILAGTVESAVDRMEHQGGETVMREAIREVDRAIDDARADHESAVARRLNSVRQQRLLNERLEQLTEKARIAIEQGRDDLAEAALTRQVDFEDQLAILVKNETEMTDLEGKLDDNITALKARKQQMDEALSAFLIARQEASLGGDAGTRNERGVEKKVERAEAAFDRAMSGAGGVNFTRSDADTINKIAEIDGIVKTSTVSERLAALKAQVRDAA